MHILILGGTGEARELAERLAAEPDHHITYALAGRTRAPELPGCAVRIGGFGGDEGLAQWIASERVAVLVDATHPFAARISTNAESAARRVNVPLVSLQRPGWARQPGDRWTEVPDMAAAADALGPAPRRVLLAIGRQEVGAFRAAPQHRYLVRSIEPIDPGALPDGAEILLARGPFSEADEHALLTAHRIEILVAKNSGGSATYGKIAAARALGLPVVMVVQPPRPDAAGSVDAALARIDRHLAAPPVERGV
jgi:precorrin-6A/cobalt-precorrin-6A reductase